MSAFNKDTFTGWASTGKGGALEKTVLPLKSWDEDSVEMDITHCGICGSDEHTLSGSLGFTPFASCVVVGHEIVGKVTRVGRNVKNVYVGERAGVGAQSGSCGKCENCLQDFQNLCTGHCVMTYASTWPNGDASYGGFADKWRGDHRFVFKIPDKMPSEIAATLFCAGVTTFAPLKRTHVNSKSVVGVMGIGGLGHLAILFSKAMGAKVVGMSQNENKRDVTLQLGADEYLVTSNAEAMASYKNKFTHILCTGTSSSFQWNDYFALLKPNGHFINLMAANWEFPSMDPSLLLLNQVFIHGSLIGSPNEIEEMLAFSVEKKVVPWVSVLPMDDVNNALEAFKAGKARFRFVLKN